MMRKVIEESKKSAEAEEARRKQIEDKAAAEAEAVLEESKALEETNRR
jgi:hypothetical protein